MREPDDIVDQAYDDFMDGVENWRQEIGAPNRIMAPFRWYGGKGKVVQKILPYVPESEIYTEAFLGAGSMFFHKKRSPISCLNDLNSNIYCLFSVLKDEQKSKEFMGKVIFTPYSRREFERSYEILMAKEEHSEIDVAWAFFVNQNQGFGGTPNGKGSDWGRAFGSSRGEPETTTKWKKRLWYLDKWRDMLMTAQIDNRDAIDFIKYWDTKGTFHYLDPPYVSNTRAKGSEKMYDHESDDEYHHRLVETILELEGMVLLSGYNSDIYSPLCESGWQKVEFEVVCHAAGRTRKSGMQGKGNATAKVSRTECIWISPNTLDALKNQGKIQESLF